MFSSVDIGVYSCRMIFRAPHVSPLRRGGQGQSPGRRGRTKAWEYLDFLHVNLLVPLPPSPSISSNLRVSGKLRFDPWVAISCGQNLEPEWLRTARDGVFFGI